MLEYNINPNIDYISEVSDLIFWLIGLGLFATVFFLGSVLASILRGIFSGICEKHHFHLNQKKADTVLKACLIVAAVVCGIVFKPPFDSILDTVLPFGDFNDIAGDFADNTDQFVINIVFQILMKQMILTLLYFIPFLLFDLLILFLEKILCDPDEPESGFFGKVLTFVLDFFSLIAVNALVLCTGNSFPQIVMNFITSIELSEGIIRYLALGLVLLLMLYYAIRDLFSSDILLAILSVNVVAAVMRMEITEANCFLVLGTALVCGFLASLIRKKTLDEDDDEFDKATVFFGIASIVGTCILSALFWSVIGLAG